MTVAQYVADRRRATLFPFWVRNVPFGSLAICWEEQAIYQFVQQPRAWQGRWVLHPDQDQALEQYGRNSKVVSAWQRPGRA
jgi:hypothetical protein